MESLIHRYDALRSGAVVLGGFCKFWLNYATPIWGKFTLEENISRRSWVVHIPRLASIWLFVGDCRGLRWLVEYQRSWCLCRIRIKWNATSFWRSYKSRKRQTSLVNWVLLKARGDRFYSLRYNRAILTFEDSASVGIHLIALQTFVTGIFQ